MGGCILVQITSLQDFGAEMEGGGSVYSGVGLYSEYYGTCSGSGVGACWVDWANTIISNPPLRIVILSNSDILSGTCTRACAMFQPWHAGTNIPVIVVSDRVTVPLLVWHNPAGFINTGNP